MEELYIFNMIHGTNPASSKLHTYINEHNNSWSINGGSHSVDLLCASATRYHNACDQKGYIYKGESPGWSSMSDANDGQIWVSFQCSPQKTIW